MKKIAILAFGVLTTFACSVQATDAPKANPFRTALIAAPAAELPATAAQLVKHAKARDWGTTTVDVVKAALEVNPAAAPSIVSAIAKAVPEMAAVAAGTAATQQPNQASAIALAATAAAPSKAGKIVAATCRAVPKLYQYIAINAAQAAPAASVDILNGVGDAIPELKPSIDGALSSYSASIPSVSDVIMQAKPTSAIAAAALRPASDPLAIPAGGDQSDSSDRGPSVGPPHINPSGTPHNPPPHNTGNVPPGGNHYHGVF